MIESAADRLKVVVDRIHKAAQRAGRNPQDITLVAVTKTIPLEQILPFIQAGIRHVAENRVQEALSKYQSPDGLKNVDATVHLIGQLQSNKVKKALGIFDVIQSVDRLDLADDLNRHAASLGKVIPCLVEVKISSDSAKAGINPDILEEFLGQLKSRTSLLVQGVMGIAPLGASGEAARPFFNKLRKLFEQSKLDVLSMGMSSDFEAAIEEGSTMVRIGTALFGSRL